VDLNRFDRIAFMYDFLAKLVFGRSIVDSQKYFLNRIEDGSSVLILGGGTGWLLADLLKVKPNCEVWYIEASARMIGLAKAKTDTKYQVHFIHGTEQDIPTIVKFNVVITNFYFDMFTDNSLTQTIDQIRTSLKPRALWIVTDFVDNNRWWQKLLLRIMYAFLRITCSLENQRLPDWNRLVCENGLVKIDSRSFYKDFIETTVYQF